MDILHKLNKLFKREEKFKWYYLAIYLIIVAIPFNHKEAFSVYDPDLVWSKYILVALAFIGAYFFARNFKAYLKDPFFLFLMGFCFFQVLSLTQTRDFDSSTRLIGFQTAIAFAYIPIRNFIYERKNSVKDIVFLYALTFIPVFLFLLVQIYLQTTYDVAIGGVWPVRGYPTRYGATFWDINHFGAFCSALSLILIAYLTDKKINSKVKIFILFVLSGLLTALYLTSSRSSLLGFLIGLTVLILLNFRNLKIRVSSNVKNIGYYLATISVVTGFIGFLYLFDDQIKNALLYRSVSFFSHLFLLKVGIIIGFQHFLFGIGANSFHAYFRHTEWADIYYYIDRAALDLKLPLHNLWLEVLAETGVVSLVIFIAFWALLLVGLYRTYIKTGEKLALGFAAGITSFLIGGFMYSYKSEFFWMFVLVAAAYVSKNFFMDSKIKLLSRIKEILCAGKCDFVKAGVFILALITLFLPVVYLIQPLNSREIDMFYGAYQSNIVTDLYTQILVLFRYVIGNYSYTGRVVSLLFYVGSIVLAYIVLKRYVRSFYSFVFLALIIGAANIIEPNLIVSLKWFVTFILLCITALLILVLSFLNKRVEAFEINNKSSNTLFIILFVSVITSGIVMNNAYFRKSYASDLFFLLELAYNRGLLNEALIEAGDKLELNPIYYFADNVQKEGNKLTTMEGVTIPVAGIDLLNYKRDVFIYSIEDTDIAISEKLIEILKKDANNDITELSQGIYRIVVAEKRNPPINPI